MEPTDLQKLDMALRAHIKSLCAPIWWESGRQTVINSGSMCVIQTPAALIGVTNYHVLSIYEKHKAEKPDIFCQLGSAPFDPTENVIACSKYWDLATFTVPKLTLDFFGHKVFEAREWPPKPIDKNDVVILGGYPEGRRSVPPGLNPTTMTSDFVSFRCRPHGSSWHQASFQIDVSQTIWLPNVYEPFEPDSSFSGMSGGPCFRLVAAEDPLELAGIIYEGDWSSGIILARQASLISSTGQIEPKP